MVFPFHYQFTLSSRQSTVENRTAISSEGHSCRSGAIVQAVLNGDCTTNTY